MNFICTYTNESGLTVSLTVSADQSVLAPSFPTELGQDEVQHLASSSFEKCLPEITGQLVSVHQAAEQVLNVSLIKHLETKVTQMSQLQFPFPDDPKAALMLIADHIDKMQLGVEHVSPVTNDKRDPGIGCVQTHAWLHDLMGCAHEARRIGSQMGDSTNLYLAAVQLREFLEMQPIDNPVLWSGDRKTKVIDLPHYKSACKVIDDTGLMINGEQSS